MLKLTALGVGHGDATLLQVFSNDKSGNPTFNCLIDGGESNKQLASALSRNGVEDLDLLVLSHFDADHIGGLDDIWADRSVRSYWAPCLRAFERHTWLFGHRIQSGLTHARQIEESLRAAGSQVIYPLEGYSSSPVKGVQFSLHVLSPAARLIRTLLLDRDIEWLFTQMPMPLGWLGLPEGPPPVEQPANELNLDRRFRTGALAPQDVDWIRNDNAKPGTSEVHKQWSAQTGIDPQFFGDSVLNNTSLVIWLNISVGARSYKVLLTGDQENWTYLLMKHPLGLQVDVLKSPHHGGQLYIEQTFSNEEVLSAIRPRALLFSANGRHGLPHSDMRASGMRWGASVFCTSQREAEVVLENRPEQVNPCCHGQFSCSTTSHDVGMVFDERGIHADRPACHTGLGTSPGPIIQIRQHSVERSAVVQHLHEGELRKHLAWLKKMLKQIHLERVQLVPQGRTGGEPIGVDHLATLARSAGRQDLAFCLTEVLAKGWERNELWSSGTGYRYGDHPVAYMLPSSKDIESFVELLRSKEMLLFVGQQDEGPKDKSTRIAALDQSRIANLCDETAHFPSAMFNEAFWPSVHKELLGWRCYRRNSQYRSFGLLAFSRSTSPNEMCERLLKKMLASGGDNSESVTLAPDWSSPLVLTTEGKSPPSWQQALFSRGMDSSDDLDNDFAQALGISSYSPKMPDRVTTDQITTLAAVLANQFAEVNGGPGESSELLNKRPLMIVALG